MITGWVKRKLRSISRDLSRLATLSAACAAGLRSECMRFSDADLFLSTLTISEALEDSFPTSRCGFWMVRCGPFRQTPTTSRLFFAEALTNG